MTTIHTGNTTSTGFIVTSDTTGDLVIKTGGAGGTTAITIGDDQRVSFAQPPLTAVPAFRVVLSALQNISLTTYTTVGFDIVTYDTHSWWDTGSYRYIPQIAGYYQFNGFANLRASTPTRRILGLHLNGNPFTSFSDFSGGDVHCGFSGSSIVYMNGSTDYVDLRAYIAATSGSFVATSDFQGFLVRAA